MLPERRVTRYEFDETRRAVVMAWDGGPPTRLDGDVEANALLDRDGHLVGLDLAPSSDDRLVLMLGAHEAVARVAPCRAQVRGAERSVTVEAAERGGVAPGPSPFLRG